MPHPDVEARASELLRVLQVPEAQAEYLRPRVTDLEGLAATLDAGARVTRQGKAWPSK